MLSPEQESLAKHPVSWSVTQKLEALDSAQQEWLNHSSLSDGTTTIPLQLALNYQHTQSCFQEQSRSCLIHAGFCHVALLLSLEYDIHRKIN